MAARIAQPVERLSRHFAGVVRFAAGPYREEHVAPHDGPAENLKDRLAADQHVGHFAHDLRAGGPRQKAKSRIAVQERVLQTKDQVAVVFQAERGAVDFRQQAGIGAFREPEEADRSNRE